MSVREKIKVQLELEGEYARIAENEMIYFDEITLWVRLRKITTYLSLSMIVPLILGMLVLPRDTSLLEDFSEYPLQVSTVVVSIVLMFAFMGASSALSNKVSKIQNELGLHREERLYLRAYEAHKNVDAFLTESNPKRKLYFKKLALESAQEMTKIVEGWKYGNIRLVSKLVGNEIDLIKDNMKRLVLSNVAGGEEITLKKISGILIELCKYIHSPSIEGLSELNITIGELPFKEYKVSTRKEKMGEYFYGKPRMFRLLFAFGVTIAIAVVLLYLGQNLGVMCAVAVTSFWGAFMGFDKIFRLKEK
jgi:hypothetical protein